MKVKITTQQTFGSYGFTPISFLLGANIIGGIFVKILKTTFCIYCIQVGWLVDINSRYGFEYQPCKSTFEFSIIEPKRQKEIFSAKTDRAS